MKKRHLLSVVLLLLLNACSSDSGNSVSTGLVKEINSKTVNYDGTQSTTTYKYFYVENKISSISYSNSLAPLTTVEKYFYTGDLITGIKVGDGLSDYAWLEYQYHYDDSNRLLSETTISHSNLPEDLKIYSYNADNTVIRESYHGTTVSPANLYETVKLSFDNSNRFVKLETFDGSNWIIINEITYSNYNSPFKNILGYDKLFLVKDTKNGFGTYTNYTNTSTYDYTVNDAGYPKQRIEKYRSSNGGIFSTTVDDYKYY